MSGSSAIAMLKASLNRMPNEYCPIGASRNPCSSAKRKISSSFSCASARPIPNNWAFSSVFSRAFNSS